MSNIQFLPIFDSDDKHELYNRCHIFVLFDRFLTTVSKMSNVKLSQSLTAITEKQKK